MEERLLLDRVALEGGDVPTRDQQPAALIEAYPADPPPAFPDQATVPTGKAADSRLRERLPESAFCSAAVEVSRHDY
jgi:hypothetical protein